jgi:hypothetical protein
LLRLSISFKTSIRPTIGWRATGVSLAFHNSTSPVTFDAEKGYAGVGLPETVELLIDVTEANKGQKGSGHGKYLIWHGKFLFAVPESGL